MLVLVGSLVVISCVLGGYLLSHGHILALWQPYELMIIGGGSVGAFLSANPAKIVKEALSGMAGLVKGPKYRKQDYVDLLALLYDIFSLMRKQGLLALEPHIEDPQSSSVFTAYPRLIKEHHLIEFITDCLRLIVGGNMNPHELEQLLEVELETHQQEAEAPAMAVMKMADALPGFGIVAAVLGIVTTMSQLGGDTSQIGEHIAGALVGTFLGILLCYGFVGPLAAAMESRVHEDGRAFECVKVALLSSLRGYNPKVSVEFARKTLSAHMRPNFQDFEEHLKGARAGAPA
ncbi:flagellar motor stator protein MotA [Dyella sp.]|jgi:chemotaxis protein MotA|uniref:flagellar motor stator protein MotA n=1 Tax=Dyella sp. TaxID=1869338 RepID=UPI002D05D296|nr:flagellar motor stator protein MotA [Dyella sp.]HTC27018.1 flagellar motor stator protein MotA [Dyella sp.]